MIDSKENSKSNLNFIVKLHIFGRAKGIELRSEATDWSRRINKSLEFAIVFAKLQNCASDRRREYGSREA